MTPDDRRRLNDLAVAGAGPKYITARGETDGAGGGPRERRPVSGMSTSPLTPALSNASRRTGKFIHHHAVHFSYPTMEDAGPRDPLTETLDRAGKGDFAGLCAAEAAETQNVSARTVEREWTHTRAWLARELDPP